MTTLVTMRDVRRAGVCGSGVVEFFKRYPQLDKREFFRNGLPAEQLEATGDLIALRVIEAAKNGQ